MCGGNLGADARLALRHDRIAEADDVNAFLQHRVGKFSGQRGVAEHHGTNRMCAGYPLWSALAIVACAHLADAPRGQKDLAAFAQRLSQRQRRALGIRLNRVTGQCPAPANPPSAASTPKWTRWKSNAP